MQDSSFVIPATNFSLARWAAKTNSTLVGKRQNDPARYRIEVMYPHELVFVVSKDGEYYRTLKLRTYGSWQERELMLPHVAVDKEYFQGFNLVPDLGGAL